MSVGPFQQDVMSAEVGSEGPGVGRLLEHSCMKYDSDGEPISRAW